MNINNNPIDGEVDDNLLPGDDFFDV